MSRKGNRPIEVPSSVEVSVADGVCSVKGPKGSLSQVVDREILVKVDEGKAWVSVDGASKHHRTIHGLYWSLIRNMIIGVSSGFQESLEIVGVGYRAQKQGNDLQISLGFSHPILIKAPDGVTFEASEPTKILVSGIDKQAVGQVSAKIKKIRRIDPYKGKGIKSVGAVIRRKAGKSVK